MKTAEDDRMVTNIYPPNSRMKDFGDQPAVEFDLQSYKFEDDMNLGRRRRLKD